MRLYDEHTENYIFVLSETIRKDPASMEHWRCVHIHPTRATIPDAAFVQGVLEQFKQVDCDWLICEDMDMLLISRDIALPELVAHIVEGLGVRSDTNVFDLFYDWRAVRSLLLTKTLVDEGAAKLPTEPHYFGELENLHDAFCEARKMRKSRQPQYVMIVDDDPLTRRLVANAFKEQYALITANDAQEAVANYLLYAPDIVFLDIGLPDTSGFSVLRQIIACDPEAYIVMFSGNSYLDNVTAALGNGAAGFVAKPFKKDKLRHYIEDSTLHHSKYVA